jgi:ribosome-associated protein
MDKQTSRKMAAIACSALEDKKAEDIRVIDIEHVSVIADYFIIASGTNRNQVQALAENVEEQLYKAGFEKKQSEGYTSGNWILLDYGDIVVHIFDQENRLFYDLERIWRDGNQISVADLKAGQE